VRPDDRSSLHRILAVAALAAAAVVLTGSPAVAACHSFTVEVSPATVREGGEVTVTVRRDAAVDPSQIDVSTVDGTARARRDYTPLRRTVSFTTETEQTFTISTGDDSSDERAERFRVHLSNPGGCAANPSFVVGPDAQVMIRDNDAAPPPSPTPQTTEGDEASPEPEASPSPAESPLAADDESGGGSSAPAIAGVVAALVIGTAAAYWLVRRRRTRTTS
jgi:hypothetical protein